MPKGNRRRSKDLRRERNFAAKQGKIEIMEVRALTKNVRISPEKARHISRLIQGKSAVEELAIAMESRCYHGGDGRTRMKVLKYAGRDVVAFILGFAVLAAVIAMRKLGI